MNSNMDLAQHHALTQRALDLGRSNDPASVRELVRLLSKPSAEIRRLAAAAPQLHDLDDNNTMPTSHE